jgi:hypothetical protein
MTFSAFSPVRFGQALILSAVAVLVSAAPALAQEPATFEVADFTFTRPAEWKWIPVNSPMRKAQLKIPGGDAATSAEVTFFYFTGQGGDPEANTKRWLAQFESKPGAEKIEKKEYSGTNVTIVTTEGTFASGMPGQPTTPMANYALVGAIMQGKEGSVFVKMTGPAALVKDARGKFDEFIATAAKSRK